MIQRSHARQAADRGRLGDELGHAAAAGLGSATDAKRAGPEDTGRGTLLAGPEVEPRLLGSRRLVCMRRLWWWLMCSGCCGHSV